MPNPTGELRPGMYASVKLEVERKQDAMLLPLSAVLVEKGGSFVFRVADGKAQKTPVQIGFKDLVNVEIAAGLRDDQPVIVVGTQGLTDGQAVAAAGAK